MKEFLEKHVTTDIAAEMLDLKPKTISEYLREGTLQGVKLGRWYVSRESIAEYQQSRKPAHRPKSSPADLD